MLDVQNDRAEPALPIDRVGIKNLKLPVKVRDKSQGLQRTVADVDLSVELPAEFKGAHMSRFVEALEEWREELDYRTFKGLLQDVRNRLQAKRAHISFRFPYFLPKQAPTSGHVGLMSYDCFVSGDLDGEELTFEIGAEAPVMTVCPCSLAICGEGAHSQRALTRISARFTGFLWLEDLIDIAEDAGSSPVYPLLKREDEKTVVETAFGNPTFVEDVVRRASQSMDVHPKVTSYRVEVESLESIHGHNAYASIEKQKSPAA